MSSYSKGSLPPAVWFDASIGLLNDKNQNAIGFHRLQICKPADGFQLQDSSSLVIDLFQLIAACSVARGHFFARLQLAALLAGLFRSLAVQSCSRAFFARLQLVSLLAGLFRSLAHCSIACGRHFVRLPLEVHD